MRDVRPIVRSLATSIVVLWGCFASAAAASPVGDETTRQEAQAHFRRGVELYGEGDSAGSLVELTRAYDLAPTFKILYNLGQISYQRRDYAAAMACFKRYLVEGGTDVPEARRREVEDEIQRLQDRIAHLDIRFGRPGARISIDDVEVGITPLRKPVAVNLGRRRIEIVFRSGERAIHFVDVAGGETAVVQFGGPARSFLSGPLLGQQSDPSAPPSESAGRQEPDDHGDDHGASGARTPWIGWGITAACTAAAAITGTFALSASSDRQRELGSFPASQGRLQDLERQERIWALGTDALLIATVASAAVSIYLTLSRASTGESPRRHFQTALVRF